MSREKFVVYQWEKQPLAANPSPTPSAHDLESLAYTWYKTTLYVLILWEQAQVEFLEWYLNSGRVDGRTSHLRRFTLALVSLALTVSWVLIVVWLMPESQNFFVRMYSNPLLILAFVAMHLSGRAVEFLRYRIAEAGEVPSEVGAIAQNEKKIFDRYGALHGKDAYYHLPIVLRGASMLAFFVAVMWMLAQGPFQQL